MFIGLRWCVICRSPKRVWCETFASVMRWFAPMPDWPTSRFKPILTTVLPCPVMRPTALRWRPASQTWPRSTRHSVLPKTLEVAWTLIAERVLLRLIRVMSPAFTRWLGCKPIRSLKKPWSTPMSALRPLSRAMTVAPFTGCTTPQMR